MLNFTTLDDSARLYQAGFPQPDPAIGQNWWFQHISRGYICMIITHFDNDYHMTAIGHKCAEYLQWGNAGLFAPTAEDILREIGGDYGLFFSSDGYEVWKANTITHTAVSEKSFETAAEAAADAWFKLKCVSQI